MNFLENKEILKELLVQGDKLNTVNGGVVEATEKIEADDEAYIITISAPTVRGDAFNIFQKYNQLYVTGYYQSENNEGFNGTFKAPIFTKSIIIPDNVDFNQIEAIYDTTELKIRLPIKSGFNLPGRKINIKTL